MIRSRRRIGWCEFSTRLFRPLWLRCSTPGMIFLFALSYERSLSVIMTRGGRALAPSAVYAPYCDNLSVQWYVASTRRPPWDGASVVKRILVMLFLSAFLVTSASTQFTGPSRSQQITTVDQALMARRGQDVILNGFVVKHLRERYYLFRDATGEIRVRIDRLHWRDRRVTSKTSVRLTGRTDRDFRELSTLTLVGWMFWISELRQVFR